MVRGTERQNKMYTQHHTTTSRLCRGGKGRGGSVLSARFKLEGEGMNVIEGSAEGTVLSRTGNGGPEIELQVGRAKGIIPPQLRRG